MPPACPFHWPRALHYEVSRSWPVNLPANGEDDLAYNKTLEEISDTLKGRKGGTVDQRVANAWRLLYKAADYEGDSRLSETLANSLISQPSALQG